jgi:lipoprotein-anchoring transpeptidase ErfK/SrfK
LGLFAAGLLAASVLASTKPFGASTETDPTGAASTDPDPTTDSTETTVAPVTPSTTAPTTIATPQPSAPPKPKPKPRPRAKPIPKPKKPKPKKPEPLRLPSGVTVGGVHVAGLTPAAAEAAVRTSFRSPLVLLVENTRVSVSPARFGAVAYVKPAVSRAKAALRGEEVEMTVSVRGSAVRAFVRTLAARFDRTPIDSRVVLRGLAPTVLEGRSGLRVRRERAVAAIVRALEANRRGPLELPARAIRQRRLGTAGSIVVIRRDSKRLYYYEGEKLVRTFKVATGQPSFPTPIGSFHIMVKWRDPWWYPPSSSWARGLSPVPPGPGNPLGTRWMGISSPAVGIHGTPDPASLGYSASHGCIRMFIPSAEWLFDHVKVGTPVFILRA